MKLIHTCVITFLKHWWWNLPRSWIHKCSANMCRISYHQH